ncbi:MAG: sigma 54-interacting transcriptional regulator, partial [Nitrospirales bacterium]
TQAKVLRALEEQQFTRVGGTRLIKVDVRVIAASNKDLPLEIERGNFREDLFYRLNVLPIEVPPLRKRQEDIPILVRHFLHTYAEEQGLKLKEISPGALEAFRLYDWPGNVRELRNIIERLMIMEPGPLIEAHLVNSFTKSRSTSQRAQPAGNSALAFKQYDSLRDARNAFEREYISRKLRENNWNVSRTADELKIERSHLHRKIKLLNVELRPES